MHLDDPAVIELISDLTFKALNVPEDQRVDVEHFWEVAKKPIPPEWIKERSIGKDKFKREIYVDYVEGGRIRQLLNEACGGPKWSFIPVIREIYDDVKRYYRGEAQNKDTPYVAVLGVLVIPGIGAQPGWGTKTLDGGTATQQYAFGSAITTALKAAAKEFGIGLSLYVEGDLEADLPMETPAETAPPVKEDKKLDPPRQFTPPKEAPQEKKEEATFDKKEVERLKQYKEIIGLNEGENDKLAPLIEDWSGGKLKGIEDITPMNLKSFNDYLDKKINATE